MPAAVLVRRAVVEAVEGFDESLRTCGDRDLWGRVARCRGRGIGRIEACAAGYRMRSASLSHNPAALLRDARTVLHRLHADDPRVSDPNWALAEGASARQLPMRRARFAPYAAGLAISEGLASVVTSILESAEQWRSVTPSDAAEYLLSALCFARCRGLESIGEFWLDVEPRLITALRWIETRGGYDHFTDNVLSAIGHQSGRASGPKDLATIVS